MTTTTNLEKKTSAVPTVGPAGLGPALPEVNLEAMDRELSDASPTRVVEWRARPSGWRVRAVD